jgi:hypothetical protein
MKTPDALMSRQIVTVAPDDPLNRVKQSFDSLKFHHLLRVVDDGATC